MPAVRKALPYSDPIMSHTETAHLIRHGKLVFDESRVFAPDATDAPDRSLPEDEPGWIVPLSTWHAQASALQQRKHPVAILIAPDDDPWTLREEGDGSFDSRAVAFIAVDFPAFTDGRGYSHAQVIRQHLNYHGELRAVGDVLIDTVFYMARCGFDSFAVKAGHDPQAALAALTSFSQRYQQEYCDVAKQVAEPG